MSFGWVSGGGGVISGTYPLKGTLDATLASNLPATPADGDVYLISVAGSFENDASILPASYGFTVGDKIFWDGTNWRAQESGDSVDQSSVVTSKAIKYSIALG